MPDAQALRVPSRRWRSWRRRRVPRLSVSDLLRGVPLSPRRARCGPRPAGRGSPRRRRRAPRGRSRFAFLASTSYTSRWFSGATLLRQAAETKCHLSGPRATFTETGQPVAAASTTISRAASDMWGCHPTASLSSRCWRCTSSTWPTAWMPLAARLPEDAGRTTTRGAEPGEEGLNSPRKGRRRTAGRRGDRAAFRS
jgi:hypothetical protein